MILRIDEEKTFNLQDELLSLTDGDVKWESNKESVAKVDESGKVTALSNGNATITATLKENEKIKKTMRVNVATPVEDIVLDDDNVLTYVGEKINIDYKVLPENAENKTVKWTSSNYEVVKVDKNGKAIDVKNKTISVEIPAGVDTGSELRISGKGSQGYNGGPNGDIYLQFKVKDHPLYKREDYDVFLELPVSITDAVLGTKKEIPTLYGNLVIQIDAGTQNNTKLRIKGKGIESPRTHKKGDMYVIINVMIPEKLDKNQKDLFKSLSDTNLETNQEFKNIDKYL